MHFLGRITEGEYADDCHGIHPDTIQQYYGTSGEPINRFQHQTGAGNSLDSDDDTDVDNSSEIGPGLTGDSDMESSTDTSSSEDDDLQSESDSDDSETSEPGR